MTKTTLKRLPSLAVCLLLFVTASAAQSTELMISATEIKGNQVAAVELTVDAVENLAGIKVVMTYDPKLITFIKAQKTQATAPLMHVVNDKTLGKLVLVMAGAKGIGGKNVVLMKLSFKGAGPVKQETQTEIKLVESQLMSDKLKIIAHDIKLHPLTLVPEKTTAQ